MTTVAWDGKTMAGDGQSEIDGLRRAGTVKIHRLPDGSLVGFSGRTDIAALLLEWFQDGCDPDKRPQAQEQAGEDCCAALQAMPDGELRLHMQYGWASIGKGKFAIGSGAAYAITAMHLGLDAPNAVATAIELDVHSGWPLEVLDLEAPADEQAG